MFVPALTPVEVPEYVILPDAKGVPLIGRTLIPDHVNVDRLLAVLAVVTQIVIVVEVGVTVFDVP